MATRIVTELHDDIDGSNATHTVRFALDGVEYEIDLSNRNANRLRNSFEEFVRHARKVGEGRGRKAAISARADKSQIGPMREWLREHGYEVSNRGRIPACCKGLSRPVIDHVPPEIGAHQHRWLRQGGAVDQQEFINFVRRRGLAVIATRGADGAPQAALVGITATGWGELVFDTSRGSRKYRNLSAFAQVALVIGWDNEMTVQCEGTADIPTGADRDRCLQAYFAQYPDGVDRAHDPDIVHVRVRPSWLRYSDYRPESLPSRRPLWGIDSCARDRSSFQNSPVRYAIALGQGGWVVRNGITGRFVTQPATSEEAQQSEDAWDENRRSEWGYVARFASGADQKSVGSL